MIPRPQRAACSRPLVVVTPAPPPAEEEDDRAAGAAGAREVALTRAGDVLPLCRALQPARRVAALACAGEDPAAAAGLALRLCRPATLRRPLHPLLAAGAAVHRLEVDSYHSKGVAVEQVAELARRHGLRPRALPALEQAVDEMLLNALFDAPTLAGGAGPRYRHLSAGERVALRLPRGDRAVLRCAGDRERFVVAVRDRFGSLRRQAVLSYLTRCALAREARASPLLPGAAGLSSSGRGGVGAPAGGAGVGLYLIACSAWELLFRLRPGCLTEVVCSFPVGPVGPVGPGGPPPLRALVFDEGDE